ncbi:MAG: hypothetical protein AAGG07_10900 [Planctomycetota bacterium]
MRKQTLFLSLWIAFPIAVISGLMWWIVASFDTERPMMAEPVGAGAGETGGANAIGEAIRRATGADRGPEGSAAGAEALRDEQDGRVPPGSLGRAVELIARDRSGTARPGVPLVVLVSAADGEPFRSQMKLRQDGRWGVSIPAAVFEGNPTPTVAFFLERDGVRFVEVSDGGAAADARPLPLVDPSAGTLGVTMETRLGVEPDPS